MWQEYRGMKIHVRNSANNFCRVYFAEPFFLHNSAWAVKERVSLIFITVYYQFGRRFKSLCTFYHYQIKTKYYRHFTTTKSRKNILEKQATVINRRNVTTFFTPKKKRMS